MKTFKIRYEFFNTNRSEWDIASLIIVDVDEEEATNTAWDELSSDPSCKILGVDEISNVKTIVWAF